MSDIQNNKDVDDKTIEKIVNEVKNHTLHCGNLPPTATLSELKDLFKPYNCRNVSFRKTSNGEYAYAFITFESDSDLTDALNDLKYHKFGDKEIVLSEYKLNFTSRKHNDNRNLFVNNLPTEITSQQLEDSFNVHGEISSVKIARNNKGEAKGYGFVKFKSAECVQKLIDLQSVVIIADKVIKYEIYNPSKKVSIAPKKLIFTNCFIKNFPPDFTEEKLMKILEPYGKITDLYFPINSSTGRPVGFACANFSDQSSAEDAIFHLHGKTLFTNQEMKKPKELEVESFYIQKSEKKKARLENLSLDVQTDGNLSDNDDILDKKNLYVRNIPNTFLAGEVLGVFVQFGRVVDFYLSDDAVDPTKLFGYVCYSTHKEAAFALKKSSQMLLDDHQLKASYYRSQRERKNANLDKKNNDEKVKIESKSNITSQDNKSIENDNDSVISFNENIDEIRRRVMLVANDYNEHWHLLNVNNETEFSDFIASKMSKITKSEMYEVLFDCESDVLEKFITSLIEEAALLKSEKMADPIENSN